MLIGYRSLVEIYRQSKRFDALLAVLGEGVEKTGVLETLGAEAQTVSGDAESMRGIVETARNKMKSEPVKFGYGRRLAVALLALEAKQYETAGEFFNLALAHCAEPEVSRGKPARGLPLATAEVFMVWGVGLLMRRSRRRGRQGVSARHRRRRRCPTDNPAFHFYLAGALAMADRYDEALAAARIAAEKKDSARFRGRPAWVLYRQTLRRGSEGLPRS